ncbi:MAG: hypothetical protein Ct9H300mP2_2190 [Candidatus Neomarinimicrobiota bacterium]|nr:MAG: hypothetical protein Ct9H300mP2_2190 [Candidatus Neomarinimicrobiota bacterium]
MNRSQTRRVWPLVFSAAGGFLLAAFLFIPDFILIIKMYIGFEG